MALKPDNLIPVPNKAAKSPGIKTLDTIIQLTTGIVVYGRY